MDKKIKYEEKGKQLHHLEEELKELVLELERILQEIEVLYSSAACENEEQFRDTARKAAYQKDLQQQLERVSVQLKMISLQEYEKEGLSSVNQLEAQIQETKEKMEAATLAENRLHDELAQVKHTIGLLEDGGTYAEYLHRFKLLQSDFAEEAREWAVFKTAKEMLQKTVQIFKEENGCQPCSIWLRGIYLF